VIHPLWRPIDVLKPAGAKGKSRSALGLTWVNVAAPVKGSHLPGDADAGRSTEDDVPVLISTPGAE
jgi:hypothetical protein